MQGHEHVASKEALSRRLAVHRPALGKKMDIKRSRASQAFEESCVGLAMAVLFTTFKLLFDKAFVFSDAIFTIFFMVVFFFLKGYFWGATSGKLNKQMMAKKEEMQEKMKELKCFKCFHPIISDEHKCPHCGWTWEI
jgi:hypothetical protein